MSNVLYKEEHLDTRFIIDTVKDSYFDDQYRIRITVYVRYHKIFEALSNTTYSEEPKEAPDWSIRRGQFLSTYYLDCMEWQCPNADKYLNWLRERNERCKKAWLVDRGVINRQEESK